MNAVKSLLRIPDSIAPDDARRRQIVAALAFGILLVDGFFLLAFTGGDVRWLLGGLDAVAPEFALGILVGFVSLAVLLLLLLANRSPRVDSRLSASLLLALVFAGIAFSDTPAQLSDGRSLITWMIPVVLAPFILPGYTAFIAALAASLMIWVYAL